jgi:uncharacterized protein
MKYLLFFFLLMVQNSESKEFQRNIYGGELNTCSTSPLTGYFRDGHCSSNSSDFGNHSVCAIVTKQFLIYSKSKGNNLISPNKKYNFPGLKHGDRWCLCAKRWLEAKNDGINIYIVPESTNIKAQEDITLEDLH